MLFTISISYYFQYFFNLKTLTRLTKRNPTSRASLAGFETKYKHVEIEFVGEFNFKIWDSIGGFKSPGSDSNPNSCFVIVIAEFWGGIDCVVLCCWFRYVCYFVMILQLICLVCFCIFLFFYNAISPVHGGNGYRDISFCVV